MASDEEDDDDEDEDNEEEEDGEEEDDQEYGSEVDSDESSWVKKFLRSSSY